MVVRLRWNAVAGAVLAAAILISASVVFAQSGSGASMIAGCVKKSNGALRILSSSAKKCRSTERRIAWNVKGPSGTPGSNGANGSSGISGTNGSNGTNGAAGAKGDPGAPGAAGQNGATGPQGATGSAGTTGARGATGASGTGIQNIAELNGVACQHNGISGTIATVSEVDPNTGDVNVRLECAGANQCGNGNIDGAESCDDGGKLNGDGCSVTCQIEPGFQCTGQPSVCAPIR